MNKRIIILMLAAFAALAVVIAAADSFAPLVIGALFAYVLSPAARFLEGRGIGRSAALFIIYLILAVLLFALFYIGVPYLIDGVTHFKSTLLTVFDAVNISLPDFLLNIFTNFQSLLSGYFDKLLEYLMGTVNFVINFAMGVIISFYFLLDRERISSALYGLLPKNWRPFVHKVCADVRDVLGRFWAGEFRVGAVLGMVIFAALSLMRIPYAFILAVLAAVMEVVPVFGPVLAAVPAVIVTASVFPQRVIWVILVYVAVQQLENAVISPKIMGERVGLHPIITMMSVAVGARLFGFAGVLLAVPVCGIIRQVAQDVVALVNSEIR